jgi:replication fork clamp-binding protein CrfC
MPDGNGELMQELERLAGKIIETLGDSAFADTVVMLTSILVEQVGVSRADISHLATHVPEVVRDALRSTDPMTEAHSRTALYDVVFIGMLFNQYRDIFIERVESTLSQNGEPA